jgi:hypothetical protein
MQIDAHTRPVHTVRWLNFRGLLRQRGLTVTAAAGLLDKTQGQISHFGGKRPPGKSRRRSACHTAGSMNTIQVKEPSMNAPAACQARHSSRLWTMQR